MRRDDSKLRIGIIGLGIMGAALAARLHERGYRLFLYNRTRNRSHAIAREGDRICSTPAELAGLADVAISFVSDDAASEDVWFGPDGAAAGAPKNSICIEGSTLSPEYIESWAKRLRDRDLQPIEMELPRPLLKYARQASLVEQPTLPGLGLQYCCSSCA
jgi:3-hydroxyisobutyrate dehydrogenase